MKRIIIGTLGVLVCWSWALMAEETSPAQEIVIKAVKNVLFEMTANLKLTREQVAAVTPIVTDNIVKVRDLQQKLQDGSLDVRSMYDQRQQLYQDEDQALAAVLTPEQVKLWDTLQNHRSK